MRYALNTAQVNGAITHMLTGTAAIVMSATGYTQTQVPLVVTAALVSMEASGELRKAIGLGGTASIAMSGAGALKYGKSLGAQQANIALTAKWGIPDPMPVPSEFHAAAQDIKVDAQDNQIVVPRPDRTVDVEPVDRTITVESEVE